MYESEANHTTASFAEIPSGVLARFAESRRTVSRRTLIPWGEHCTECVWPTCYDTCDFYSPRLDGRCRRFVQGMVRIDCPEALNGYLLKVTFRPWAKLWSEANIGLRELRTADRAERRDLGLARVIAAAPGLALRRKLIHTRYSIKKHLAIREVHQKSLPNCLLVESYNPNPELVLLTLTIRRDGNPIPFQHLLEFQPGFNRCQLSVSAIERVIKLTPHFQIDLIPNNVADSLTLFFGAIDFVVDSSFPAEAVTSAQKKDPKQICKCVVWDLDNTLWDGILVEDGPETIRLKPGIDDILKQLDERGILISAVSKNNYDDAKAALHRFGIEEYFLFPQISWDPKSNGIQQIARSLNIGLDSLLFVDDSRFEREQVKSACPEVMLLDATEYLTIPQRSDCQAPVTDESKKRRLFYRDQQVRDTAQKEFHGDYLTFLRNCNLRLTIQSMTDSNLERVHELTQRTNQMNFSGNRYTRDQLLQFMNHPDYHAYVLDCEDRFGSYGTIGFCLVRCPETRMTDLMFSCRIQAKRVEHAFLSYLIRRYRRSTSADFLANYRKTKRNAGPGKVFDDFGFQLAGEVDGVTQLRFPYSMPVPDDGLIAIDDAKQPASTAA